LAGVGGIDDPRVETVAGLFAYHPEEADQGNLGTTCRRIEGRRRIRKGERRPLESRMQRLLACDRDEICDRLRPVVLAAKAKGISVNYEQLLLDIILWEDWVKAAWAREYWCVHEPSEPTAANSAEVVP
jgi:CRISPR system Cascade subunit CasB